MKGSAVRIRASALVGSGIVVVAGLSPTGDDDESRHARPGSAEYWNQEGTTLRMQVGQPPDQWNPPELDALRLDDRTAGSLEIEIDGWDFAGRSSAGVPTRP